MANVYHIEPIKIGGGQGWAVNLVHCNAVQFSRVDVRGGSTWWDHPKQVGSRINSEGCITCTKGFEGDRV